MKSEMNRWRKFPSVTNRYGYALVVFRLGCVFLNDDSLSLNADEA